MEKSKIIDTLETYRGTPDLLCSSMFLGYMDIYRRKKSVRGATRGPRGWGARPLPRGSLGDPPDLFSTPKPLIYTETSRKKPRSGVPPPQASVATENQSRPVPAPCRRGVGIPLLWPSSSSWRSPWRGGSSSPSGLRVCTSSYVFDLSLSCSWFGTILMYHELCYYSWILCFFSPSTLL